MRRLFDVVLAYALVGALIVIAVKLAGEPASPSLIGRPRVVDGDTLDLGEERLRLIGIDAPELDQPCNVDGRPFACGRAARDALKALIGPEKVACTGTRHDIYGRRLVKCHIDATSGEPVDLAERMVAAGLAVSEGCCAKAERQASAGGLGIWAGRFERPSQWRHAHPRL